MCVAKLNLDIPFFLSQHFTQWAIVTAFCFVKGNKCILDIMGEKVGKLICSVKLETHSKSDLSLLAFLLNVC